MSLPVRPTLRFCPRPFGVRWAEREEFGHVLGSRSETEESEEDRTEVGSPDRGDGPHSSAKNFIRAGSSRQCFRRPLAGLNLTSCFRKRSGVSAR